MKGIPLPRYLNNFQLTALMFKVPDEYISEFVNEFQIAALIARIPYQQAILMHNIHDIINYFHENEPALNEAIGSLTVHIMANQIINTFTSLAGLDTLNLLLASLNDHNIRINSASQLGKKTTNSPNETESKNSSSSELTEEDDSNFLGSIKFHYHDNNFDGNQGSSAI